MTKTHFDAPLHTVRVDEYKQVLEDINNGKFTYKKLRKYLNGKPKEVQSLIAYDIYMGNIPAGTFMGYGYSNLVSEYPIIHQAVVRALGSGDKKEFEKVQLSPEVVEYRKTKKPTRTELHVMQIIADWKLGYADWIEPLNHQVLYNQPDSIGDVNALEKQVKELHRQMQHQMLSFDVVVRLLHHQSFMDYCPITKKGALFLLSHMEREATPTKKTIRELLDIIMSNDYDNDVLVPLIETALSSKKYHAPFIKQVLKYRGVSVFSDNMGVIIGNYYHPGAWTVLDIIENTVNTKVIEELKERHQLLAMALFPSYFNDEPGMEVLCIIKQSAYVKRKQQVGKISPSTKKIMDDVNAGSFESLIKHKIRYIGTDEEMREKFPLGIFSRKVHPALKEQFPSVYTD